MRKQNYSFGDRIRGDKKFWAEFKVEQIGVYTGLMSNLRKQKVKWHQDPSSSDWYYITLNDIVNQVGNNKVITVIEDDMLCGHIYRFGNHGPYWEYTGTLWGYA